KMTVHSRRVCGPVARLGELRLQVPAIHNALDALAAVAVGIELHIPFGTIAKALSEFRGSDRRFQVLADKDGITVVDDNGHHPKEISAAIAAARSVYPGRRLVAVWQPYLYSRTQDFPDEFAQTLSTADAAIV